MSDTMSSFPTASSWPRRFSGRVAFVTGAGAGIGRETALQLAAGGAAVSFLTRSENNGAETRERLEELGVRTLAMVGDVARPDDVERAVERTVSELGRLDVVVANAGITGNGGTIVETDVDDWNRVLAVNLSGVFHTVKYAIPVMVAQGGGAIVIVGSDASVYGWQNLMAYTASKHALVGMTRSLALDHGAQGIRTNLICPTVVETDLVARYGEDHPDDVAAWIRGIPLGRMAKPAEVAQAICHLASEEAGFTNGTIYTLDGGLSAGIYSRPEPVPSTIA